MIDLTSAEHNIVTDILHRMLPGKEVRAFGSRVKGKARPYSDLDIVIIGDTPIEIGVIAELRNEFEESDLPFRIDILDWALLSDEFKQVVSKTSIPLSVDM